MDEPAAFQAWLERQPTYRAECTPGLPGNAVAGKASYAACAACHGANGEGNVAMNAPRLSGQGAWYLERQLQLFKQGARGTHEKDMFGKMMAPMAATLADDTAIADVVGLHRGPAGRAGAGNDQGRRGQGPPALRDVRRLPRRRRARDRGDQRPRLQGMSDWYMATQLKNFRDGVRGAHAQDIYGAQMALIAGMLADDAAIGDILAYINSR